MQLIHSLVRCLTFMICLSCSSQAVLSSTTAPYDGEKFENIEPFEDKSLFSLLSWKLKGLSNSVEWPEDLKSTQYKPLKQKSIQPVITVINHATVLIQMNGVNIITDPHFSKRASPVSFAGPKRAVKPGIAFEDIPKIDIILISHNHYDHLDLESLKMFSQRDNSQVLAGLKTKNFLKENGIENSVDMDWWEKFNKDSLTITFVPSQHWSARGLFDKREMLWGGFFIQGETSVYFAGDTGYGKFFKMIKEKLGKPEISLIPIGAYEPRWFMKDAHMNPEESIQAFLDLESSVMIGIHFGTFKLTDEGYKDPEIALRKGILKRKLKKENFIIPTFGKGYLF